MIQSDLWKAQSRDVRLVAAHECIFDAARSLLFCYERRACAFARKVLSFKVIDDLLMSVTIFEYNGSSALKKNLLLRDIANISPEWRIKLARADCRAAYHLAVAFQRLGVAARCRKEQDDIENIALALGHLERFEIERCCSKPWLVDTARVRVEKRQRQHLRDVLSIEGIAHAAQRVRERFPVEVCARRPAPDEPISITREG